MLIYLFKSLRFPPHGLIEHISFPFPIACRLTACLPAYPMLPAACCLLPLPLSLASSSALSSCLYPCPIQLAAWHFSDSDRPWAKLLFYIFFSALPLSLSLVFVLSHSFAFFFVSLYREYEESQVAKMLKQNEKSRPEPVNVMTGSVTSGPGSKHRMRIRTKQCPRVT